jgi:hypothetical protein
MSENSVAIDGILEHHGVKGMKWGVRRNRSAADVSVEGKTSRLGRTKIKTKGGEGHSPHNDAVAAAVVKQKLKKSGSDTLSNEELKTLATRLNLERQVGLKKSGGNQIVEGAKYVDKFMNSPEGQTALKKIRNKAAVAATAVALA